jgi:hypothetical protein
MMSSAETILQVPTIRSRISDSVSLNAEMADFGDVVFTSGISPGQ